MVVYESETRGKYMKSKKYLSIFLMSCLGFTIGISPGFAQTQEKELGPADPEDL
jgi:hypothetical protein